MIGIVCGNSTVFADRLDYTPANEICIQAMKRIFEDEEESNRSLWSSDILEIPEWEKRHELDHDHIGFYKDNIIVVDLPFSPIEDSAVVVKYKYVL